MCVALHPSEFSDTTLYVGEARHPDHGLVHVVGYQNHVKNTSRRSNCMILHFPSAEPMDNRSALDCSGSPEILNDMRMAMDAILVGSSFGEVLLGIRPNAIHVFDVGSYSVVMSATPALIPSALDQIPVSKRPVVNPSIFDWYQNTFPDFSVALCCFDANVNEKLEPMLWWYKPKRLDQLVAPAIDAHDGKIPDLDSWVQVDHFLLFSILDWENRDSRNRWIEKFGELARVDYTDSIDDKLASFLPSYVLGGKFRTKMKNGDFILKRDALDTQSPLELMSRGIS